MEKSATDALWNEHLPNLTTWDVSAVNEGPPGKAIRAGDGQSNLRGHGWMNPQMFHSTSSTKLIVCDPACIERPAEHVVNAAIFRTPKKRCENLEMKSKLKVEKQRCLEMSSLLIFVWISSMFGSYIWRAVILRGYFEMPVVFITAGTSVFTCNAVKHKTKKDNNWGGKQKLFWQRNQSGVYWSSHLFTLDKLIILTNSKSTFFF